MLSLKKSIQESFLSLYNIDIAPTLSVAPKSELGEYCINVFPLAKPLGKSPNIIAEEVCDSLAKKTDIFQSVNALSGYVNFFLTDALWKSLGESVEVSPREKNHETVIVDYIGMNVGKPPHIGHICTPLQGQALINTLGYLGYHVIGDSHLGDWGSLFGKLIVGFKKYGNETKLADDAIGHLLEIYIAVNADAESDPAVEQECRDAFRELANGNPEYTALWAKFTSASIETNKKILESMHIHQDYDI